VAHAVDLLRDYGDDARLLAGGASLIPLMKLRLANPGVVIDLAGVPGLRGLRRDDGHVTVGALTRHVELERSPALPPIVHDAAAHIGDTQVRNMGTIGGGIAECDPAGDWPPVLLALDGSVTVVGPTGAREIAAGELFLEAYTTALAPDEVLTEVRLPVDARLGTAHVKLERRAGDFAIANCSVAVRLDEAGACAEVRVALGGVGLVAQRVPAAETVLVGQQPTEALLEEAAAAVRGATESFDDVRASAAYRQHVGGVLFRRAFDLARSRASLDAGGGAGGGAPAGGEAVRAFGDQGGAALCPGPPADGYTGAGEPRVQQRTSVQVAVNGKTYTREVEPRLLLIDFVRNELGLTGSHIGCDTTTCGACTIHVNGRAVKSCTMFAVQANGSELLTVEGLANGDQLHPVQQAFHEKHGLQCGYCTPGMLMSAVALLKETPRPSREQIKRAIAGNLCRCTGYHFVVESIEEAARKLA
jgi:xanthine dehydrogenase iron-sulfur cluster and FAD-binding subunit A